MHLRRTALALALATSGCIIYESESHKDCEDDPQCDVPDFQTDFGDTDVDDDDTLRDTGTAADDLAWRMPLGPDFEKQLRSNFADFANIGGRDGGTVTAGCFLAKFAEGMNWAHLDIAGTA